MKSSGPKPLEGLQQEFGRSVTHVNFKINFTLVVVLVLEDDPPLEEIGGQSMSVGRSGIGSRRQRARRETSSSVGGGPSGCPGVQLLPISIKNVGREEGGEEGGLVGDQ